MPFATAVQDATATLCIADHPRMQCRCADRRVAAVDATIAAVMPEWFTPDDSMSVIILVVADIVRF